MKARKSLLLAAALLIVIVEPEPVELDRVKRPVKASSSSINLTLPTPTTTTAGHLIYLSNTGTASFIVLGNSFNGIKQLVQLNSNGALPVLNGANLTNLNASLLNTHQL